MSSKLSMLKPRVEAAVSGKPSALGPSFTDDRRIRGHALQRIRAIHFEKFPLCIRCLAKQPPLTRVATQLDHIVPLHQGGADTMDPFENRQGLCDECHDEKSKEDVAYNPVLA